jgi:hypothetical protein
LDNVANAGGSVNLTVNWITPTHLHVAYRGPADVTFQAIRFGKIVITLEDVADNGASSTNSSTTAK